MAGKITALRFQKQTADRVNVYLDDRFAFGLPAIEAARLRVGQDLSDADVTRLQGLDSAQKAYDRAVRFLGYRPRSEAEVRRHLAEAQFADHVVEAVIQRLAVQGYLNDAEFARYWVENREKFRPRSPQALRQELRLKGLDNTTIEATIGDLDPDASAYDAARPRAQRLVGLVQSDPAVFRRKLSDFLLRRGFVYEVIRRTVARLEREVIDEDPAGE